MSNRAAEMYLRRKHPNLKERTITTEDGENLLLPDLMTEFRLQQNKDEM